MKNIIIFLLLLFASLKSMGQIDTIRVNIKPRPSTPTLSATKTNINTGESVTVSASGCNGNIIWDISTTGSSVNVSPTKTTTYSAFCNLNGCNGATASITVGVNSPIPTIKGSANEMCSGNEVTLTAYGCSGSIEWSTGVNGIVSIKVNPTATTTYQAYCNTSAGRSAAADFTIKVNPYPAPPLVNNATIIIENNTTLNATGCNETYEWNTGAKTQSITVSPRIQTDYKVKCIQNGCPSSDAVATVTVISPKSDVYAAADKICKGKSTTIFAKNCNGTYKWNTGATGESISVSPAQTTQYSVVCSTSVGDGTPVYITITVNDLPNRPVLFGDTLINNGKTAKIKGICSGNAIRWGTGDTTEIINVTPKQTSWYKANCISTFGCIGTSDSIRVRVATPPIEIVPKERIVKIINKRKQISICEGEKVQLDLIGCETASKVNWNSGETTRKILIQPLKNASYWASCTDNAGTKYDSLDVLVNAKPKISLEKDTIRTTLSKLTTLKVKNCVGKITWLGSGNISQIGGDTLQVIPTESIKTYRAFCTNLSGCNSDTLAFIVVANPAKPMVQLPTKVCEGSMISLKATGCPTNTKYVWEIAKIIDGKNRKEIFEGENYEGKFLKNDAYVVYCAYLSNPTIKSDTLKISLKPTPITLENVIVYPNPTYDIMKIKSDGCMNGVNLRLWDIGGRLLYDSQGIEEKDILKLSVGDLPSAEYVLQIIANEPRKTINKLILKANNK